MEEMISKFSKNNIFSAIYLQSANHQVPTLPKECHFISIKAPGNLYQF